MTAERSRLLILAPDDDIAVALDDLAPGERLGSPSGQQPLTVRGAVPRGHKVALREVAAGAPVRKYGQIIGVAAAPISAGEHVHTHNLEFAPGMQGANAPAVPGATVPGTAAPGTAAPGAAASAGARGATAASSAAGAGRATSSSAPARTSRRPRLTDSSGRTAGSAPATTSAC